jgi:PAS domain S-box-containing protein
MVPNDPGQISLAYLPPTRGQTRLALAGGIVLLLGLAVLLPFASKPLPRMNGFIPAFDAIISVADLITAGLLLAQFSITRSRAIWALACGYLFSAAIVVAHALTFPGAFSSTGSLGINSHVNFRVYLLWHLGLPAATFVYVWLRHKGVAKARAYRPTEIASTVGGSGVVALGSCIAWLALLPAVDPVAGRWLTAITMLICAAALSVLWLFRRSVLDQWLMVVILAMIIELAITGLIGARVHTDDLLDIDRTRIATVGFYAGRIFSLVTSSFVLIALLAETSRLYAGVARTNTLGSAVKASQSLSSEIQLPRLIERLMTIALQNAGADRGLLILPYQSDYRIEAEALANRERIVLRPHGSHDPASPETIVRYAFRTQERVILGDAATPNMFSDDPYLRLRQPRSVLCLPLVRQGMLGGLLYLENTRAPHVFGPERARLLELLAAQAAISLENATLYADLQLQVGLLQQLPVSAWTLKPDGTPDFVNQVWLEFSGQTLEFIQSHPEAWMAAVHPDDRETAAKTFREGVRSGQSFALETRSLRARDGTYRRHLQQAVVLRGAEGKILKFVGTTTDIDDQKRAEETLRQAQTDLAHVARVATLNAMTASIAHEVSQPLSGILTNANTGLRMLAAELPNLPGVAETVRRTVRDANRASSVIKRLQEMFYKKEPITEPVDLNNAARDVIAISAGELQRRGARLETEFADGLPLANADRVQLQQVILNLLVNAADAMDGIEDRPRSLFVKTELESDGAVRLEVRDAGRGFDLANAEKLFEAFHTTKANGMGVGLTICRSIIESHKGRLWATPNDGPGATFSFSIPVATEPASERPQPGVFEV